MMYSRADVVYNVVTVLFLTTIVLFSNFGGSEARPDGKLNIKG